MRINTRNNLTQITDGSSNTIVVGEQPSDAPASKRGSHCGQNNNLRQRGDSFERGSHNNNLRQRGDDQNNLKQPPNRRYEFDGREAAKQIQDGTNNTILLPENPIKVYTRKESK